MVNYLTQHRTIAYLVSTAYFLGLIYFHDAATVMADWLKYKLTLPVYNLVLLTSGLGTSLALAWLLWRTIRKDPGLRMLFIWFLFTIILMAVALSTMMVVNMEAIHYPQYAILAILIFPLVRRYSDSLIIATVLGIIDEIFQYLVLNPTFKYFDFNDIILNMIGAGAGLLVIAMVIHPEIKSPAKWHRSSPFIFVAVILLLGMILSVQNYITFYPVPGNYNGLHWFSLYRENLPDEFWTYLYGNRYYHILRPWEGIVAISALTFFYGMIDAFNNAKFTDK